MMSDNFISIFRVHVELVGKFLTCKDYDSFAHICRATRLPILGKDSCLSAHGKYSVRKLMTLQHCHCRKDFLRNLDEFDCLALQIRMSLTPNMKKKLQLFASDDDDKISFHHICNVPYTKQHEDDIDLLIRRTHIYDHIFKEAVNTDFMHLEEHLPCLEKMWKSYCSRCSGKNRYWVSYTCLRSIVHLVSQDTIKKLLSLNHQKKICGNTFTIGISNARMWL